jgi:hypothetical protein
MSIIDWIKQPWPWYIAGPLIGLMIPALLLSGNKTFGISSSLGIYVLLACLLKFLSFNTTGKKNYGTCFL